MFSWAWTALSLRRRYWRGRAPAGAMRDLLAAPLPSPRLSWERHEYLVLDFETTGTDPAADAVLSAGHVPIVDRGVRLHEAVHRVVQAAAPLPAETVVIHGITDDRAARGAELRPVVDELLAALAGRVLVAHHAATEQGFLDRACRALYGVPLLVPVLDTLRLEYVALRRQGRRAERGELRLGGARARRGLPRYQAHDALVDAIATAELFLAQAAERGGRHAVTLGELLASRAE